jgi:phytoene dehydrogenase-like protein
MTPLPERADAVVVGGGHNGLVCAAYLARAGLDTVVVEARHDVGGCAASESVLGATVNVCNCDHLTFRTTPVLDELDLRAHGLRYLDVDPSQVSITWGGGPAWTQFHDTERTLEVLARLYPGQVDGYRRYLGDALPAARLMLAAAGAPPSPAGLIRRAMSASGARGAATLVGWSRQSALDVLRRYFSAEELVAPALALGPTVWGLAPSTPRTGLAALVYAVRHVARMGRPVGGSGALPEALAAAVRAAGGSVATGTRVAAISCQGDRVVGVETADGRTVRARVVVSACDPHATFLQWLRDPPPAARRLVDRWRATPVHAGYESKVDAVVDRLPAYRQLDDVTAASLGVHQLAPTTVVAPLSTTSKPGTHSRVAAG